MSHSRRTTSSKQPVVRPPPVKRRHHIATFEAVKAAYEFFQRSGVIRPTVKQIRIELKGGSDETIDRHLLVIRGRIFFRDTEFQVRGWTTQPGTSSTSHAEDPTL